MSMIDRYEDVRERMETACRRAGRRADEVRLVAVSKYVDTERMQALADLGVKSFGENHAQEVREKKTFFERNGIDVHFIGQLQTNKIKYICGTASIVESIDRQSLLDALESKCAALDLTTDVLLQVNIGDEPQKGGVSVELLPALLESAGQAAHLRLRGLMCVPPALEPEAARPYFARMRTLFDRLRGEASGADFNVLSMGMSHDFPVAIEEGATEVRVGTALFGARDRK